MSRTKTFQDLFRRYRRPGDFILALGSFVLAVVLLASLPYQTTWVARTKLFAQPAFWPALSLGLVALFSGLHLIGALVSDRIPGRLKEMTYWLRSAEYALWFMGYVLIVPVLGYLLGSIAFALLITWRLGYRGLRWALVSAIFAIAVVVLFKGLLHVKIPAGEIYYWLPSGAFRSFLMTYL